MKLSGSKSRLIAATKELSIAWNGTRYHWRDEKSREFDQRYMVELTARVERTLTVIDKLEALLNRIQSDCE